MSKIKKIIKSNRFLKGVLLSLHWLYTDYFFNHVVFHIPFWIVRRFFYRLRRGRFGKGSQIDMRVTMMGIGDLKIGNHCHINRDCLIDARGGLIIHDNVSISHRVVIMTGSHDYKKADFPFVSTKIEIEDYVWIGVNATIVGNVHIGRGAVVCAGAVVTKDVEPFAVVAGIPAVKIKERPRDIQYTVLKDIYPFPTFA